MRVRPAAVAGTFYPSDPDRLRSMIQGFLDEAAKTIHEHPKAIIAPHAGYIFSGPVAATAYVTLDPSIDRVVLLGPSHYVGFEGVALPDADAFATPLGTVPLAADLHIPVLMAAHTREHSLEVQIPFLQMVLGAFELIPIAIGRAEPERVADMIEELEGGPETVIVVSSDLSHYHDYETAGTLDSKTASHIVRGEWEALAQHSACGLRGVQGVMQYAARRGLETHLLDLRNSGDTAGDRMRVVGYGSFAMVGVEREGA